MENIVLYFGGWHKRLIIENTESGIKKEFPYTLDGELIKGYINELL